MLGAIEDLLQAALSAALGKDANLLLAASTRAPVSRAKVKATPQVTLLAPRLTRRTAALADDDTERRDSAQWVRRLTLSPDPADARHFTFPAGADPAQLAEVLSAPGRLLAPGDGYLLGADGIHVLGSPPAQLLISLRGQRSRGYVEKAAVVINIEIGVWTLAIDAKNGATLMDRSLAAVLAAVAELDLIDLTAINPPDAVAGLSQRLMHPLARLSGMEHSIEIVSGTDWLRAAAQLELRGELVQSLTLGAPDPSATIRRIETDVAHTNRLGKLGHDLGHLGGG